jgi:glycogen synthase
LKSILGHAVSLFGWRENWNTMVRNAMKGDYSWTKSSQDYLRLFNIAYQKKQL